MKTTCCLSFYNLFSFVSTAIHTYRGPYFDVNTWRQRSSGIQYKKIFAPDGQVRRKKENTKYKKYKTFSSLQTRYLWGLWHGPRVSYSVLQKTRWVFPLSLKSFQQSRGLINLEFEKKILYQYVLCTYLIAPIFNQTELQRLTLLLWCGCDVLLNFGVSANSDVGNGCNKRNVAEVSPADHVGIWRITSCSFPLCTYAYAQ
jgi:hypothetical protein